MSARDVCASFKDRECPSRRNGTVAWPGPAVRLGEAVEITYRSDKWIPAADRRRGKTQDYFHQFEGDVEVLVDAGSRTVRNPGAPRRRLARPPAEVAGLAETLELKVRETPGGPIRAIRFDAAGRKGPGLLAFRTAPDRCVLVVSAPQSAGGAFVIRGGKLDVRPEGIVG